MATTKFPPALSLSEAVRVIGEMYSQHKSREVSLNLMPDILGVKEKSSNFPAKIAALQKFGLIERQPNDQLYLTDRAMMIINPVVPQEMEQALFQAANEIDVLGDLTLKHNTYQLPSQDQLKQYLMKSFGIKRENVNRWCDFIVESFRELARHVPKQGNQKETIDSGESKEWLAQANATLDARTSMKQHYQNFLLPTGNKFEFSLPDNVTTEDLDFVIGFFELKKKTINKDAVTK